MYLPTSRHRGTSCQICEIVGMFDRPYTKSPLGVDELALPSYVTVRLRP